MLKKTQIDSACESINRGALACGMVDHDTGDVWRLNREGLENITVKVFGDEPASAPYSYTDRHGKVFTS